MLHAADVAALQAAKKQAQEVAKCLREMEEKVQKATAELQQGRADWEHKEKSLKVIIEIKACNQLEVNNKEHC